MTNKLSLAVFKRASAIAMFAAILAVTAATAFQQNQPTGKAEFPSTTEGKLARAMLDAINSGDQKVVENFIKSSLSSNALKEDSLDGYLTHVRRLYAQSGGFELMQVLPARAPGEIRFLTRTKRGGYWAQFITRLEKDESGKLDGWGFRRVPDPEAEKADAWASTKMSDADALAEIERHVAKAASDDRFSGVVLVAKGDRVVFNKAYGLADKATNTSNKLDTKFNLGSMNKMFTSVAIAQLVQAGKLSYDDTIAKVLPEYPNTDTAAKITIHQLLTHTSGLGDFFKPEFFQNREKYRNPKDYFPVFANDALRFEPGKSWSYSNAGFIVLGAIVENASGQNYFDYVRDHIFIPAGMKDTASYAVHDIVPNLATGYTRFDSGDPLGIEPRRNNVMTLPMQGSPAGGGYSTAPDLFKFAQALRSHKLINPELTEKVTSGKVDTPMGAKYSYGFIDESVEGKSVRGHSGGAPGINSYLNIFWDGSYTVIVQGNYDPPAAQDLGGKITRFLARQATGEAAAAR
ncbi:MAG TPA: serine hydrolase domain-containing protein [Blastocatellia bacterium]|nr:serine hydrolase domain-containing protein [Blastocatellia bacterium]